MMPTLKVTPDAAARMYQGPRYHLSPEEHRRRLLKAARTMKRSRCDLQKYLGKVVEAIIKCRTTPHLAA